MPLRDSRLELQQPQAAMLAVERVVRGNNHHAALLSMRKHRRLEIRPSTLIQSGERLIENPQLALEHRETCECGTAYLPRGKLAARSIGPARQACLLKRGLGGNPRAGRNR